MVTRTSVAPKIGKVKTPVMKKSPNKSKPTKEGIQIIPDGKYPQIRHADITLPPRPAPGDLTDEFLFWNPRPLEEVLNPAKLAKLIYSMRLDGQIETQAVNAITDPNSKAIIKLLLIAGERRYWAQHEIITKDLPCVDATAPKPEVFEPRAIICHKNRFGTVVSHEGDIVVADFDDHLNEHDGKGQKECPYVDVVPTKPGSEVFGWIGVKLYYDLPPEAMMRIAFSENANSEPLSTKAEVELVERWAATGKKQAEIAYALGQNITFVSQRLSFRKELPPAAFEALLTNKMTAHMGVKLLGMPADVRQQAFDGWVQQEKMETGEAIHRLRTEKERHEDEADLHMQAAKEAEREGDNDTAAKERRKAEAATSRANKTGERLDRVKGEAGNIKQGHGDRANARLGLTPRKKKMLPKEQIDELYVKGMVKASQGGVTDPITGEEIPMDQASIVRRTAKAILEGELDPLAVIREYNVSNGIWTLPEETSAAKADRKAPAKRRGKHRDEEEEDEEDLELDEGDEEEEDEEEDFGEREPTEDDLEDSERFLDDEDEDYERDRDFGGRDFDSDAFDREWN